MKVWKFAALTLILLAVALTAFPLSAYLGKGTNDPDIYEFFGWFIGLGFLVLGGAFAIITFSVWLFLHRQKKRFAENLRL